MPFDHVYPLNMMGKMDQNHSLPYFNEIISMVKIRATLYAGTQLLAQQIIQKLPGGKLIPIILKVMVS